MARTEARRLVLRPFATDDWQAIQELNINTMSPKSDPHDHDLPTSERDCQRMASYSASRGAQHLAVRLKSDGRLIGSVVYSDIDDDGQLDLGHVIHTEFQDDDHDTEALRAAVHFAFDKLQVRSIVTRKAPDWGEQLAPVRSLGFEPLEGLDGQLVLTKDAWAANPSS